jgi:hypothetical protein
MDMNQQLPEIMNLAAGDIGELPSGEAVTNVYTWEELRRRIKFFLLD